MRSLLAIPVFGIFAILGFRSSSPVLAATTAAGPPPVGAIVRASDMLADQGDTTCRVRWGKPKKNDDGFYYVTFSNDCDDQHFGWCKVKRDGAGTRYGDWIPGHDSRDVNIGILQDHDQIDCGAD
jgi:hypothetical protein